MKQLNMIIIFILLFSGIQINAAPGENPVVDFADGIFYKENSYDYDSLIHELDLGAYTGDERALIVLDIEVLEAGDNSAPVEMGFREYGSTIDFQCFMLNNIVGSVSRIIILTDEDGKIEFWHNNGCPFIWNPTGTPFIYGYIKVQITCKWVVQSET